MTILRIRNIPAALTVADLRAFFSVHVERQDFIVFHYRHRHRRKRDKSSLDKGEFNEVLVQVADAKTADDIIASYNNKEDMQGRPVLHDSRFANNSNYFFWLEKNS
jgi:hypothetical protein